MIDKKYTGVITKADGTIVDDWIILRAKDAAVPDTLRHYIAKCIEIGADTEHIEGIRLLIQRVEKYQAENGSKVPNTLPEDIIFDASEGKG